MPRDSFVLHVAALLRTPGSREHRVATGRIRDLQVGTTVLGDPPDVTADLWIESVHGGLLATGAVMARWSGECRRCLAPATGDLQVEVRELFEDRPEPGGSYAISGDNVDVEPLARDAILLNLPLAPLCRQDCRGLCATCGVDLNEEECLCAGKARDDRWAALDALDS